MTLRKELLEQADELLSIWKRDHSERPSVLEEIINFKCRVVSSPEHELPAVSGGVDYCKLLLWEDDGPALVMMTNRFVDMVSHYKSKTQRLRLSFVETKTLPDNMKTQALDAIQTMIVKLAYLMDTVAGRFTKEKVTLDVIVDCTNDLKTSYGDLLERLHDQSTAAM